MVPDNAHIIYCDNIVSRWHNDHYHWICTENGVESIYIHIKLRNFLKWLVQYQNRHHHWIHIEKLVLEVCRSLYNDWILAVPKWVYIVLVLVNIQGHNSTVVYDTSCYIMWSIPPVTSSIFPCGIFLSPALAAVSEIHSKCKFWF